MKSHSIVPFIFLLFLTVSGFGQKLKATNEQENGIVRCYTVEYENSLREKFANRATTEEFENWIAPKIEEIKSQRITSPNETNAVKTIPVIFHIITDGVGSENLSQATVQDQIDQLNIDYANLAGSGYGVSSDTEIQFCLARQDESGYELEETGINRITAYGDDNFLNTSVDSDIKPNTQWDPTKYMNVWVVGALTNGSFTLLGYAQFPDSSGLDGLNTSGGAANTDGIVVIASSVGSVANPNPDGGQYASGRTLTHEAGHWLGLRHIWGDTATCTNDDYCDDTPDSADSNYNCSTIDSCPVDGLGNDMVENYMDYTDDTCMDTFTADQKLRIDAVMANSPRRTELSSSNVCQPGITSNLDGQIEFGELNLVNCPTGSITPEIVITNRGNNTLTSATIEYYVDSETPSSYNWAGSLAIGETDTVTLPTINLSLGAHTLNTELIDPNGGTDEQPGNNITLTNLNISGANCSSVGTTTYNTSTEGVVFNTISNLNSGKPSGYSDFTSISTDINIDSSYDLSVYANSDGNYQIITFVWIDWNQNCSFDDSGEQYDLGTSVNIINDLTTNSPLSITIPTGAALGNPGMRVTTKYTVPDANQFPTSCENGHDAEVEDYTINVFGALSIDEYYSHSLTIYPNPVTDKLTIKVSDNYVPDNYKIYNMIGQLVTQKTINNLTDIEINTSALSNGLYFIKISKGISSSVLKFLKN